MFGAKIQGQIKGCPLRFLSLQLFLQNVVIIEWLRGYLPETTMQKIEEFLTKLVPTTVAISIANLWKRLSLRLIDGFQPIEPHSKKFTAGVRQVLF